MPSLLSEFFHCIFLHCIDVEELNYIAIELARH